MSRLETLSRKLYAVEIVALAMVISLWWTHTPASAGRASTLVFLLSILTSGIMLIVNAARRFGDPHLLRIVHFCIARIVLTILLGLSWETHLRANPASEEDQDRYYTQAQELAVSGFRQSALPSLNYAGVLYIYAAAFSAFGHNVLAASAINTLLAFVATVLAIHASHTIHKSPARWAWCLAAVLLIPELVLQDTMTSRDSLAAWLLSISILSVIVITSSDATALQRGTLLLVTGVALIGLAAVRTPALIPAALSIVAILALRLSRRVVFPAILVGLLSIAVLWIGPRAALYSGGYEWQYANAISSSAFDVQESTLISNGWNHRSIGRLLLADSPVGAVLLTPFRVLAYLAAPLPNIGVPLSRLLRLGWSDLSAMAVSASSLLYLAILPASIASSWWCRERAWLITQLPFWITIIAVVDGTIFIHERYRIMAIPLFVSSSWLALAVERPLLSRTYRVYFVAFSLLGVASAMYKFAPCHAPQIAESPGSTTIASGRSAILKVRVNAREPRFQWYGGNRGYLLAPVPQGNQPELVVRPSTTSTYWVRVLADCGTVDSAAAVVTVNENHAEDQH